MLGMGPMEIAVILVVALLIFGPGKLPEIGSALGRTVRDFRSATQDITGDFQRAMTEVQETADDLKSTAIEIEQETKNTISGAQSEIEHAAKDVEASTREVTADVNAGLTLDQADSPATRPAKRKARSSTTKPSSSGKAKSGAKPRAGSTKPNGNGADAKSTTKSTDRQSSKGSRSRYRAVDGQAQAAPSKEDPLADLMGGDDGAISSTSSRSNGRS